jgi:CDP-diacylglycerol--glycerol-3-phosphate 3-phosphatidyltransferase
MNVPILLTWARILLIPFFVALFYVPDALIPDHSKNMFAALLFLAGAITDWLDGWLARTLNQTSSFGAFLDPVADKLLVAAALVMLVRLDRADAIVAVIIIGREITISALREWMAQIGESRSVAVSALGKLKTVAQMTAITFLLWHDPLFGVLDLRLVGTALIYVAVVLTLWSMAYYLKMALPRARDGA